MIPYDEYTMMMAKRCESLNQRYNLTELGYDVFFSWWLFNALENREYSKHIYIYISAVKGLKYLIKRNQFFIDNNIGIYWSKQDDTKKMPIVQLNDEHTNILPWT